MLARVAAAFFWGALAASSLLIGAALALVRPLNERVVGLVSAFGAGVLISAVAYELVEEAFVDVGSRRGLGARGRSLTFYGGDYLIDRMGGDDRKTMVKKSSGVALALVLGTILDGIPESVVLGLGLIAGGGVSIAMLAAVFLSNFPEAARRLRRAGEVRWSAVRDARALGDRRPGVRTVVAGGLRVLRQRLADVVAFVLAFAGGSILTMLADTMMPEAFRLGGNAAGLLTTLGFALAFGLSALE